MGCQTELGPDSGPDLDLPLARLQHSHFFFYNLKVKSLSKLKDWRKLGISTAFNWLLLTKLSHGDGFKNFNHACSMRFTDFKLIRNDKPYFHTMFSFTVCQ